VAVEDPGRDRAGHLARPRLGIRDAAGLRDLVARPAHSAAKDCGALPGTAEPLHPSEPWAVRAGRAVAEGGPILARRTSKARQTGPVTVAKAYRLLRTNCETAFSDELITRNPCNLKGASVEHSPERPVLTVAEVELLANAIDERFRALVLLAAWCGLRLGEALALTRKDVNLKQNTVRIDKSAAELKSGERIVGPPKTEAGKREVSVPPHVLPALQTHLERFSGTGQDDLVFTGMKGHPLRRASLYSAWLRATEASGLGGVRFHDLRHTGATLAAATGASTKELMKRLGHASSDAALRYQHATADRDSAIAKALSRLAQGDDEPEDRTDR
jgi:integrase